MLLQSQLSTSLSLALALLAAVLISLAQASPASPRFPHLSALCANTTFTPNLYLQCHSFAGPHRNAIQGGLSNARNRYSTCIRLAIDASANLILAPLVQRDNDNIENMDWKQVGPETMIDVAALQRGLKDACPGMDVRGCPGGACDTAEEGQTVLRAPDQTFWTGFLGAGELRGMVDTTNTETSNGAREDGSAEKSVKIEFGDPFLVWNYTANSESLLQKDIYQVLNFAPDLLSLGSKVQQAAKQAAEGRDIVGIHFRGEGDWPSHVCNATTQIEMYSDVLTRWNKFRSEESKLRDIYLSCGDQSAVEMFRSAMLPLGFVVHDKHSLLDSTEAWGDAETLRRIEELNFDQKAVVEYVNLRDASAFLGLFPSTLTHIVAYERTLDQTFEVVNDGEKEQIGWFQKYILPGSWEKEGLNMNKHWPEPVEMRGDDKTNVLVVDGQGDLTDAFP